MGRSHMRVGILGTGLMGAPMALQLHQSGFVVTAWNRTPAKLLPLQTAGIKTVTTASAVLAAIKTVLN